MLTAAWWKRHHHSAVAAAAGVSMLPLACFAAGVPVPAAGGRPRDGRRRRPGFRCHGFELGGQGVGGPVTIARRLRQAGRDDPREAVRAVRIGGRQRRRLRFEDARDGRRVVVRLERPPPGHELVQQHPERELVRARVHRVAAQHLRRHVAGGAGRAAGPGQGGEPVAVLEAGQSEVDHLDGAVAAVHHVFRLQIAVDDAVRVRCRQRPGDLAGDGQDLVDGQGPRRRVSRNVCPATYSRTRYRWPSNSSSVKTVAMPGCDSAAAAIASRRSRARNRSSCMKAGGSALIATGRSRRVSRPR